MTKKLYSININVSDLNNYKKKMFHSALKRNYLAIIENCFKSGIFTLMNPNNDIDIYISMAEMATQGDKSEALFDLIKPLAKSQPIVFEKLMNDLISNLFKDKIKEFLKKMVEEDIFELDHVFPYTCSDNHLHHETLLQIAVSRHNCIDLVELLISKGASINNIEDLAKESDCPAMSQLITQVIKAKITEKQKTIEKEVATSLCNIAAPLFTPTIQGSNKRKFEYLY